MSTPGDIRASDADRERVAARLSTAHVEGRLTLTEYDERVRAAHGAVMRADFAPLTADLPDAAPVPPVARSRPPLPFRPPLPGACGRVGAGSVAAWAAASVINLVVWVAVVLGTGTLVHPWWIWVAGPWGLMLAAGALAQRRRSSPPRPSPGAPPVPSLGSPTPI